MVSLIFFPLHAINSTLRTRRRKILRKKKWTKAYSPRIKNFVLLLVKNLAETSDCRTDYIRSLLFISPISCVIWCLSRVRSRLTCTPHICSASANCFPETLVFIRTSLPHQASLFIAYATFNSPSLTDYCSRFKLSYHAAWFVFPSLLPHCFPAKSICHLFSLIIPLMVCMWARHSSTEERIKCKQ